MCRGMKEDWVKHHEDEGKEEQRADDEKVGKHL